MTLNQVMASSVCLESSLEVTLNNSFGVCVGKKHHRLWPEINAFHADVPEKIAICDSLLTMGTRRFLPKGSI